MFELKMLGKKEHDVLAKAEPQLLNLTKRFKLFPPIVLTEYSSP